MLSDFSTSNVSNYGLLYSDMRLIFSTLIGILFIIVGLYFIFFHKKQKSINASIVSSICYLNDCNVQIKYSVNNINYTNTIKLNNNPTSSNIIVYYENDPNKITTNKITKWYGWLFILLGILMFFISYLIYYFVHKYKKFALFEGVVGLV